MKQGIVRRKRVKIDLEFSFWYSVAVLKLFAGFNPTVARMV